MRSNRKSLSQTDSLGERIDFHTHILPQMDDGSKSVEMSRQMLDSLSEQGIGCVVLSPHFYASRDNPVHFLEKRSEKLALLQSQLENAAIQLYAGAEVHYFDGITAMQELPQMRIEDSEALLIEMPMCTWSSRMINDIAQINRHNGIQVVLAHIDRYLTFGNLSAIRQLASCGVIMQVNAEAFDGFFNARKALKLFDDGLLQQLGSDCHNMTSRPPNLADAYAWLEKKRGAEAVQKIIRCGQKLLGYHHE